MEKELTDEEKKIAEALYKSIRDEITSPKREEKMENVIKRIVKLSEDGLKENEILGKLSSDGYLISVSDETKEGKDAMIRLLTLY